MYADSDFELSLHSESDVLRDMWKGSLRGSDELVHGEGSVGSTKLHEGRRCFMGVEGPSAGEHRSTATALTGHTSGKVRVKGR